MKNSLTDTKLKKFKSEKAKKLYDGDGLFVLYIPQRITADERKRWQYRYTFNNKEQLITFGNYPYLTIEQARKLKEEAKCLLANGINPSQQRKNEKLKKQNEGKNSFEFIAREFLDNNKEAWSKATLKKKTGTLQSNIFPFIGKREISSITPPELLTLIRTMERRGVGDLARYTLIACSQVFRYAISSGKTITDPTRDLRDSLKKVNRGHRAAVIEPKAFGEILKTLENYKGSYPVQQILKLYPLVFVRPAELTKAKWEDISFDTNEWRFTTSKTNTPLIVPLSKQSQKILKEMQPISGHQTYVFPGATIGSGKPMHSETPSKALKRMEINEEQSVHGFRASARTMLAEQLKYDAHLIELQISHVIKDPNGRAYNRTSFLDERTEMMQAWADYLDEIK